MDAERIAKIKARLDAATPRPWEASETHHYHEGTFHAVYAEVEPNVASGVDPADAELIAHAPTDIEDLLAEVERLRAEADTLRVVSRTLDAVAAVTPCSCSAQRTRAQRAGAERDALAAQVEAVRALHERVEEDGTPCDCCDEPPVASCAADGERWPCTTIRTLGGDRMSASVCPWDEHGEAFLAQLAAATPDQWDTARDAAWAAPRVTAWVTARDAAWAASRVDAWAVSWDAAWDDAWDYSRGAAWAAAWAAVALVVRDLISTEHYDTLTRPMRLAGITVHPDDPEVTE